MSEIPQNSDQPQRPFVQKIPGGPTITCSPMIESQWRHSRVTEEDDAAFQHLAIDAYEERLARDARNKKIAAIGLALAAAIFAVYGIMRKSPEQVVSVSPVPDTRPVNSEPQVVPEVKAVIVAEAPLPPKHAPSVKRKSRTLSSPSALAPRVAPVQDDELEDEHDENTTGDPSLNTQLHLRLLGD